MELRTATIQRGGQAAATAKMAYVPPDHDPVLPEELIEVLDPKPGETFVDCTFGAGGHSRLIAERLGSDGELIAIDRDPTAESRWREFSATAPSGTRFLRADFVAGLEGLRGEGVRPDGILFDFGMSSMQLDAWERGFSYAYEAPLDMRMDPDQKLSAMEVVNEWPQERIARVLRDFGEERRAGSIAREIVRRRPVETTSELVAAIKAAIPPADRFGRGHPAKRAFQAIRIAVNGELEAIDRALPLAWGSSRSAGASARSHSIRSRTAGRSSSWRPAPAAASARPRSRCASAGVSLRLSWSPSELWPRHPRRSSGIRALPRRICAPPASFAKRARPTDGSARHGSPPCPGTPARPGPRRAPARRKPPRKPARKASAKRAAPRRTAGPPRPRTAARPHPRGFAQPALAGAALIPQAAVGAVGAVRDISDSSLIVRLTRGRGWIGVLCALLAGIVTLNVFSLSINTTSGRVEQEISELERSNSGLRATLADELSASKVELAAANLGLYTPPGDEVVFIDAADNDLAKLVALLENDTVLTDDTPVETSAPPDTDPSSYAEEPVPLAEPVEAAPAPAPEAAVPAPSAPAASAPSGTTGGVGL